MRGKLGEYLIKKIGNVQPFLWLTPDRREYQKEKSRQNIMLPSRAETLAIKNEQEIRKQIQGGLVDTTGRKKYGETILRSDLPKRLIKPC